MKSIKDKIKDGEFKNEGYYPYSVEPPESSKLTIAEIIDEANGNEKEVIEEAVADYLNYLQELGYYNQRIKLYNQGEVERIGKFRKALEEEFKVQGHCKADRLWQTAWDEGNSNGLLGVLKVYENLVELIK
jgi:predicted RNA-binding protein with EMAP domain